MHLDRKTTAELLRLIDCLREGDLAREDAFVLEEILRSSKEARQLFIQSSVLTSHLSWMFRLEESGTAGQRSREKASATPPNVIPLGPADEVPASAARQISLDISGGGRAEKPKGRPFPFREWTNAGLAAALAAALTILAMQKVNVTPSPEAGPVEAETSESVAHFLARVSSEEGAVWGERTSVENEGGWLTKGRLHIESGSVELAFNSGAHVKLEGPGVLDLERANRAYFHNGRLTAYVPEQAVGFVINTPRLNIIDLGTRFGVDVQKSGESELHVLDGSVEVSRSFGNQSEQVVTEGHAVRADARAMSELQPVPYDPARFEQGFVGKPAPPLNYLHYGFEEAGDRVLEDTGQGLPGSPYDTPLGGDGAGSATTAPKRTAGKHGLALAFNGANTVVQSRFQSGSDAPPRSLCFWVKIPAKAEESESRAIVGWNMPESRQKWQVGWNAVPGEGTLGSIRVDVGDGYVTGATDLRDGRWHHVGIVFVEGSAADVASHLLLYVDGQMEAPSSHRASGIDAHSGDRLVPVTLGRSTSGEVMHFNGWLDELYLFEESITPGDIYSLYRDNRLSREIQP